MWEMKLAQFLILLIVPAGLAALEPQSPAGGFGETVEQAKKTAFFQWFMLDPTGESVEGNGKKIIFQPNGPRFHDLTRVNLMVDGDGRLAGAELILQRKFVDSASEGIFARDVTQSFLQTGVNPQDEDGVANLALEIGQLKGSSAPVIVHKDAVPPAPAEGYRVYLGERDSFQLTLAHGQILRMENRSADKKTSEDPKSGGAEFSVSFRAKP
jgi:hypothetical protein